LQHEFIRSSRGWAVQVVPQISSYLTAPTALFQAGLMDVGNLQNRLGELRQMTVAPEDEQPTKSRGNFFLRAYGGDYNYHSDLSSIHYGYDADIRYSALQAGGNLYGFETASGQMMFGLAGSYGDLSFSPDRADSRKTSMDVWSASAYATWLGNNGFYIDTIVAYGGFSGTVSTSRHQRTARLKGNSFTASIDIGQNFALGTNGWSIEPQAQLVYQHLAFDRVMDSSATLPGQEGFAVALGHPSQWVGRVGARLKKDTFTKDGKAATFYGQLNLIHGFGEADKVWIGNEFRLNEFGTHLEMGVGLSVDISKKATLYGDIARQERISNAGMRGLTFNGGFRIKF